MRRLPLEKILWLPRKPIRVPLRDAVALCGRVRGWIAACGAALLILVCVFACHSGRLVRRGPSKCPDPGYTLVTGYCSCGTCCGWRKGWFGFGEPVYTYGPKKGQPKKVGVTARGTRARRGTIAADPKVYPFGTRLRVPGYGTGVVEDTGGAIKGRHIDLWFPSHAEARRWGAQWLRIQRLPAKERHTER